MLHFESNNFLDDKDESFVSINLDDDEHECEICHQKTFDPIVRVILSDEFLKFEGSTERHGDKLTRAHQICLDRWSSIIERNLKFNDHVQFQPDKNTQNDTPGTLSNMEAQNEIISKKTQETLTPSAYDINNENELLGTNEDKTDNKCSLKQNMAQFDFQKMCLRELKDLHSKLDERVTAASSLLVDELQLRDHLIQEISAQKTLIEQLVKLQKNSPTLPRNPALHTSVSTAPSILV